MANERPSAFAYVKKASISRRPGAGGIIPVSRAAKYGYSNARVSAMKSLLLKKEFLSELARVRSVDAVIEQLERTYYKDDLVKLSIHYHGSELVQIASAFHFAEVVNKLERITPDSDRKAFNVMLTKWDIVNAKTILNARRIGRKYEDVAPFLIPIGSFSEQEVKGLLEGGGESVFLKFAKTHLGKRITSSRVVSSTELEKMFINLGAEEATRIEAVLDAFYYSLYSTTERLSSPELAPIARVFRKEIDLRNLSIIARLKHHGITDEKEISKYFIKGGVRKFPAFAPVLAAKGDEETLKAASKMFGLKSVPQTLSDFEIMLNGTLAQARLDAFYRSVLSVGTILGFLFLKEEEINNIRKIAVGKEFGLPDEKITGTLVFAG